MLNQIYGETVKYLYFHLIISNFFHNGNQVSLWFSIYWNSLW